MDQELECDRDRDLRSVGASPTGVYCCVLVVSSSMALWLVALGLHLLPDPEPPQRLSAPCSVAAVVAGVIGAAVTVSFSRNYLQAPASSPRRGRGVDSPGGPG